jgi:methyl-accepting chemotaxis protein
VEELTADDEDLAETAEMIRNLYSNARTSALSGDELVDSMLADLKAGKTRALPPETSQR